MKENSWTSLFTSSEDPTWCYWRSRSPSGSTPSTWPCSWPRHRSRCTPPAPWSGKPKLPGGKTSLNILKLLFALSCHFNVAFVLTQHLVYAIDGINQQMVRPWLFTLWHICSALASALFGGKNNVDVLHEGSNKDAEGQGFEWRKSLLTCYHDGERRRMWK